MGADVLLLSDDLLDTSRVSGAGRQHGLTVKWARDLAALMTLARQEAPRLVLVDLANSGLSVERLMAQLREACSVPPRVVAYGPHVNAVALRAAREAGCDLVLPRSAFAEQLPDRLPDWLSPPIAAREE